MTIHLNTRGGHFGESNETASPQKSQGERTWLSRLETLNLKLETGFKLH